MNYSNFKIAGVSIALAACLTACGSEETNNQDNTSTPPTNVSPKPTTAPTTPAPTEEPETGFDSVLSNAPAGAHYAEVDITADGKPELLLRVPSSEGVEAVKVYSSEGKEIPVNDPYLDSFQYGAATSGGSRFAVETTSDNKGILYTVGFAAKPEATTELWTVHDGAFTEPDKKWEHDNVNRPSDLESLSVPIEWKPVADTAQDGAPQADTNGRSKADYPYYTAGHTGTSPDSSVGNKTSPEFGKAVYNAFIDSWIGSGNSQPTLEVASPVTGQTYTMTCKVFDEIGNVLCTGGNDAKVYIYPPIDPTVTKPMDLQWG